MSMGADIYDSLYAGLPDARATLSISGATIACLCPSVSASHGATDRGIAPGLSASARYKLAAEPEEFGGRAVEGKTGTVTPSSGEAFAVRVMGRAVTAGVVRLDLIGEHDEQ